MAAPSTVFYEDNVAKLVELWQRNQGRVKLFPKENGYQHPHGLANPTPLIEVFAARQKK